MNPVFLLFLHVLEIIFIVPLTIFLAKTIFVSSLTHEFNRKLEDYKNQLKIRDQAAAIGEYVARAHQLTDVDGKEAYIRANQLSLELFLWLPADIYRDLGRGLSNPADEPELIRALVAVRGILLGQDAGDLGSKDIIRHGPNIGRRALPKQ